MNYVMSLDGGGSKLACLIADEAGNIVGKSKQGPFNSNYDSQPAIIANMQSTMAAALADGHLAGDQISIVYAAMPAALSDLDDFIRNFLGGGSSVSLVTEFTMSLYGAIQEQYGGLVQAGTGSFAEVRTETGSYRVGGWGAWIGDEGSGTYIGKQALTACVHMADGRGAHTLLKQQIFNAWGIENNDLEQLMDQLHRGSPANQRALISSLCPLVGHCAAEGDHIARDIIVNAGIQLAKQMASALRRCGESSAVTVTAAGGVWKSHPLVYQSYLATLQAEFPDIRIAPPLFEPAAGGLLLGLSKLGIPVKERLNIYRETMADFRLDDKGYFTPPHSE
ncbi:N-acetylglucosamine kinase [Paenibacillus eucommiae]|nr:BadF/BadG/BcrA/BcrD ATPase family protein [Paenibacillus eucommiae]